MLFRKKAETLVTIETRRTFSPPHAMAGTASFDAAVAEFAGKALGTFWTVFFAASVVADLDLLPGVSASLRVFATRGKQADAEPSSPSALAGRAASKWWVPHAWFAHFYVVGIVCNAFVLTHALVPPVSAEHAAATLASCLFQAHVTRRLLETAFVAQHREGARMHVVGYLVGVFYYVAAPMTLAPPETMHAVCATVRVALARAVMEAARTAASIGDEARVARVAARSLAFARALVESPRSGTPSTQSSVRSSLDTAHALARALVSPVSVVRVSRVAAGAGAFVLGSAKQARCHDILARLRETPRTTRTTRTTEGKEHPACGGAGAPHYAVPRGDWFEMASSPHYLAECVLYAGLALVTGARASGRLAPMLLAIVANLALAAKRTHAWYLDTFPEYPRNRWAMVPGLL